MIPKRIKCVKYMEKIVISILTKFLLLKEEGYFIVLKLNK